MALSVANPTALVIGYGNALRGDDGVGLKVAEAVARWGLPGVRALALPQLSPELAEDLAGASLIVFVDAWTGSEDGCVQVEPLEPANQFEALGYASDPAILLALAKAVYGRCPPARVVRVPAVSFAFGAGLSPAAERGAAAALREVARLLGAAGTIACPSDV